MMDLHSIRLNSSARRLAAAAVLTLAASAAMHAQQVGPSADDSPSDQTAQPAATVQSVMASANKPLDLATLADVNYSSSTSSTAAPVDPAAAGTLTFTGVQPPPRRRYGRPRYNDNMHNADGSNKFAFEAGVGLTVPVQDTNNYLNTGYAFQVGAGRNFNKNFGVLLQFDYDHFGFTGATLNNQLPIENEAIGGGLTALDGSTHVWSFTLNPVYNVYAREGLGAYVVGGVGFYHKVADFTTPVVVTGYDYYGFQESYAVNAPIDQYVSNALGVNGGAGLTFKPSRFAGERLFAEVRYVYVFNQNRNGYTIANYNANQPLNTYNLFPQNSHQTSYFPIKFGIRF